VLNVITSIVLMGILVTGVLIWSRRKLLRPKWQRSRGNEIVIEGGQS
jgi:hypothetical protein